MKDLILSPTLRLGRYGDYEVLLDLAKKFFNESPYSTLTYDEPRVKDLLWKALPDRANYLCLASTDGNDTVIGFLAAAKVPHPFIKEPLVTEYAWYVRPEFRTARRANEMLLSYEAWGKQIGAAEAHVSRLSSFPAAVGRLYKRHGYQETETGYRKKL